jgi:hypothetical protein
MAEIVMYFATGWQHIVAWDAYDHILFIIALCAIYMMEDWKKVLVLVTAFTIGHSVTLALSVINIIHIPTKITEFLIPVTIFITAFSNVVRKQALPEKIQLNYLFALFFGLIHGLGFSSYLKSLLGTQTNIVAPLLAFNLGLEFGQILVVMGVLLFTGIVVNVTDVKRREWNIFLSAAVFGIAVVLSIERFKDLISK